MFCKRCGNKLEEGTIICPLCGVQISQPKPVIDIPESKKKEAAKYQSGLSNSAQSIPPVKPPKKKHKILIGIIIVCAVLALIGVLRNLNNSSNSSTSNVASNSTKNSATSDTNTSKPIKKQPATLADKYQSALGSLKNKDGSSLELQQISYNYIQDNPNFFPAQTTEDKAKLKLQVDSLIQYKHLAKHLTPYLSKIISTSGQIIQTGETTANDGTTLTYLRVRTNDLNSFEAIYSGSVDAFKDDYVAIKGLPIAVHRLTNASGGTTLTILLAASDVQKIKQPPN